MLLREWLGLSRAAEGKATLGWWLSVDIVPARGRAELGIGRMT